MAQITLDNLAAAIANAEGFGVGGAIPTVNNNPGDLTSNGSIASYSSTSAGWSALTAQLSKMANGTSSVYNPSMSLSQIGNLWANGDSNWASNVAKFLGVSPSSTLSSLLNSATDGLSSNVQSMLGGSSTSGASSSSTPWGTYLEDTIFVVLGLLLIAAGVFAFKQTSTVIETVGKTATRVAEVAA